MHLRDSAQTSSAPALPTPWSVATTIAGAAVVALLAGCDAGRGNSGLAAEPDVAEAIWQSTKVPGWSVFAPSVDTRRVYVSSSSGNDGNSGLSEQSPKRTLQAGIALMRGGSPDWLHIKRGDQFAGGLGDWFLSGRSAQEPMVVTTYGPSPDRPTFLCGTGDGFSVHGTPIHDVAFVGLRFLADAHDGINSQPYGVSLLRPTTRVLIEDCAIERFFTNIRFQNAHTGLQLRRTLVADAFTATASHAEGIYVEGVNDLLIEECVFDHNGWRPQVAGANATIFRHNIYIQGNNGPVTIAGNIIARAGSHGLQARSGGVVRDNVFLGNSINLLVGNNINNNGGVTASVIGNVMLDGKDIGPGLPRGWAAQFQCLVSGEIAYNVAAHQVTGTAPQAYEFDSTLGVGVNNVHFHHNVAYKWGAPSLMVGNRFTGLALRNNDLQEYSNTELLRTTDGGTLPGIVSSGNRMHAGSPTNSWMFYMNQYMSLSAWKTLVTDPSSVAMRVTNYPRPEQRIGDYDLATGGSGSLDAFLSRARSQSRQAWDDRLVGTRVAAHFRSNFGLR